MFSTSRNETVARVFIMDSELGVLFEITISNTSDNIFHPFADITELGHIPDEEETLFFAGAVFRIDSVQKESDSIWIVKLNLCNESVEQIEQVIDGVKEQLDTLTCCQDLFLKAEYLKMFTRYTVKLTGIPYRLEDLVKKRFQLDFYDLLIRLGDHESIAEYLDNLVINRTIDESQRLVLHIVIGYNYFNLSEFDKALFYYGVAYSLLDKRNRLRGYLYRHIGDVWVEQHNLKYALSYYNMALEIIMNDNANDQDIGLIHRKLAYVYRQQNKNIDASVHESLADKADTKHRQRTDFNLEASLNFFLNQLINKSGSSELQHADTLYSTGICLLKQSKYSQALEHFLQSKEIYKKHFTTSKSVVSKFSRLLLSIALVYLLLKDNFKGLLMLKEAVDILERYPSK
ncbi:unnamed protein product [Rotaria sp. Silwood2]|nr:unnamed protein product [Rotaria sp. Silwood2]CAF3115162.1 unnamed protein product [Rotaria sp. Silwood2]CAF3227166.1 unnamed protein product [Rotaria sp. Silwood2]CAF3333342.1 unnamed protein product [Rotaria sp. Silwood2]CAF4060186.1 unnamed protein product [Rotaria sp. Silwood2]